MQGPIGKRNEATQGFGGFEFLFVSENVMARNQ
jgi:hypothetical protein